MTPGMVKKVLARLYVAAGRQAGQAEELVWGEALADLPDTHALVAARQMVENVDLWKHPPTVAAFREVVYAVARRYEAPALTEGSSRVTPPDEAKANLKRLREVLRTGVKRVEDRSG